MQLMEHWDNMAKFPLHNDKSGVLTITVVCSATNKRVDERRSCIHWKVFPDESNVVQEIESSAAYIGYVYGHGKLIIEPRTEIPHNRHFSYIGISYSNSVNSSLCK